MRKQEIIVVGGNAAGPSAAAKAKRVNPDTNVKMFEAGPFISTGTCELPYLFGGLIDDHSKLVFYSPEEFYEEKKVAVFTNHFVESINRNEKKIFVVNKNENTKIDIPYDKLILATGSKAKIPQNLTSIKNLFTLKSMTDYLAINNYLSSNAVKNIVILGAGYIGIETAENLKALNYNIHLVEKANLPMPSSEQEISSLVKNIIEKENIELHLGIIDMKFNIRNEKIYSINLDGRIIESCMVISSIGVAPNSQLAISANLSIGDFNGIKVDGKLTTSDPNIYAAGDCIEIKNAVTNKNDYLPLATLAHSQGHIAGTNAAGGNQFYNPVVKNAAVKIFENVLVSVGLSSGRAIESGFRANSVDAVVPNLVKVMPESANTYGKIIYEEKTGRILGAEFFGKSEVIGYGDLISALISQKEKINFLDKIHYNYTPPNSPFINILSVLGRKAEK